MKHGWMKKTHCVLSRDSRQPILQRRGKRFLADDCQPDSSWVPGAVNHGFFRRQLASFRACKLPFAATSEPILLTQNLRERDLTVRSQHLLIAHAAHFLVCCRINIRIRCNDMIANILLDRLLEQQLADAVPEHTEDGFERFSEDFRQKVSSVLAL